MLIVIGNQGAVLKFGTSWSHLILLRDLRRTKNAILSAWSSPSHHIEVGHFIDSLLRRIVTY